MRRQPTPGFPPPAPSPTPAPAQPLRAPPPQPMYFVRVGADLRMPARLELEAALRSWLMHELEGWVRLVVVELLDEGLVEWIEDAIVLGVAGDAQRRTIAVRCRDRRGPRRPGLWAARCVAAGLAELLGGELVDPRCGSVLAECVQALRPPEDGRVQAVDHLCVPSSRGPDARRWMTTVGMGHFGLPDLEMRGVPESLVEPAARLILGMAQHLIDSGAMAPRESYPREQLITIGEVAWGLGVSVGSMVEGSARGWTRVGIVFEGGRGWPTLWRLVAPLGSRRRADAGPWISDAWRDLTGGEELRVAKAAQ